MSKKMATLKDLFDMFDEYVDADDIISANILAQISSTIVKYRLDHQMNQKDFAEFLDVSQSMVSKIEGGNYNFSIRTLVKLCNKMNLKLDIHMGDDINIKNHTSANYNPVVIKVVLNNYILSNDTNNLNERIRTYHASSWNNLVN